MAVLLMFHNSAAHAADGNRRIQTTMEVTPVPAVPSALPHGLYWQMQA